MKLTAIVVALAMLCMVMEGCDRYTGGDETYDQKIGLAIEKTNQPIVQIGDKVFFRVDEAGTAMPPAATAVSYSVY